MKFGIIAAMPQELKILVEHLQDATEIDVLGRTYYQGRIGQHEVVLVQSGIGKVMSAMSVAVLADRFRLMSLSIQARQELLPKVLPSVMWL